MTLHEAMQTVLSGRRGEWMALQASREIDSRELYIRPKYGQSPRSHGSSFETKLRRFCDGQKFRYVFF